MNGLDGAIQLGSPAQFFQRQIGFEAEQLAQGLAVDCHNPWPAPTTVVLAGNITGMTALLQKFFDHPQRNPKALGDFLARTFVPIIGSQNALPQIQ